MAVKQKAFNVSQIDCYHIKLYQKHLNASIFQAGPLRLLYFIYNF